MIRNTSESVFDVGFPKVYRGIGNEFRETSQARLMIRLRDKYDIQSVMNCPYDHATDPSIDNKMFPQWSASKQFPSQGFWDLVWNFGFVQRDPLIIEKMVKLGRYILVFTPNCTNFGMLTHKLYHKIRGDVCNHPERGSHSLMNLRGLTHFFQRENLHILESGYVDCPPWPDTVVTLTELFGGSSRKVMRVPFDERLLLFERLTMKVPLVMAHHCWVLGKPSKKVSEGGGY